MNQTTTRSSVLLHFTDQHRIDTISNLGNSVEAMRFDRCYTPTAIRSPARASLLTGVLPFGHNPIANVKSNV